MIKMIDKRKTENLIYELLLALGENPEREGLKDTPMRVSNMLCEIFEKDEKEIESFKKVFKEDFISDGYVQVRDIPFYSFCEHHMLPFRGVAHIKYKPKSTFVIGISKLARIVNYFSKGLQVQERITSKVADFIFSNFPVKGVEVTLEAEHLCMTIRGARSVGSSTKTISSLGSLEDD